MEHLLFVSPLFHSWMPALMADLMARRSVIVAACARAPGSSGERSAARSGGTIAIVSEQCSVTMLEKKKKIPKNKNERSFKRAHHHIIIEREERK